jgi:uncharacterized protein YjaZ
MARKVADDFRNLPNDVRNYMSKTKNMSSNEAYRYLKKNKLKAVIPNREFRQVINKNSKQFNIPIYVSNKMFKGKHKYAEGLACDDKQIILHPITRYQTKRHLNDLIEHENDHINVFKKIKKYHKNK